MTIQSIEDRLIAIKETVGLAKDLILSGTIGKLLPRYTLPSTTPVTPTMGIQNAFGAGPIGPKYIKSDKPRLYKGKILNFDVSTDVSAAYDNPEKLAEMFNNPQPSDDYLI